MAPKAKSSKCLSSIDQNKGDEADKEKNSELNGKAFKAYIEYHKKNHPDVKPIEFLKKMRISWFSLKPHQKKKFEDAANLVVEGSRRRLPTPKIKSSQELKTEDSPPLPNSEKIFEKESPAAVKIEPEEEAFNIGTTTSQNRVSVYPQSRSKLRAAQKARKRALFVVKTIKPEPVEVTEKEKIFEFKKTNSPMLGSKDGPSVSLAAFRNRLLQSVKASEEPGKSAGVSNTPETEELTLYSKSAPSSKPSEPPVATRLPTPVPNIIRHRTVVNNPVIPQIVPLLEDERVFIRSNDLPQMFYRCLTRKSLGLNECPGDPTLEALIPLCTGFYSLDYRGRL